MAHDTNVHWHEHSVSREEREKLNGHRGCVVWFTGLSACGKSTIANLVDHKLHSQGKRSYVLDGDNIRHGLNRDLGFTDEDRVENIRRVAEVAKLMVEAGLIVIVSFISPFRSERRMARELVGADEFIEIYVNTPLDICEARDPKGLYKLARAGKLPNLTGIGSVYEAPEQPELTLAAGVRPAEFLAEEVVFALGQRGII
jgi:bifunctional enzyme CysN/CysC